MSLTEIIDRAMSTLEHWYYVEYPQETVGFLLYDSRVVHLTNEDPRPDQFAVSETQILTEMKQRRFGPDDIFAVYHSHPTRTAEPSVEDTQFMAELHNIWPGKVHIIMDSDGYRVWVYDGEVKEIARAKAHARGDGGGPGGL